VVGFYADPAKWEQTIGTWEATYGSRLLVKSTRDHPIQWWMTGGRATVTVAALRRFQEAIVEKEITFDGAAALTRHLRNARRRVSRTGIQIAKANPDSPLKIDAAVAATFAYTARMDAVAAGITGEEVPCKYLSACADRKGSRCRSTRRPRSQTAGGWTSSRSSCVSRPRSSARSCTAATAAKHRCRRCTATPRKWCGRSSGRPAPTMSG
jgi:hypothetical protein